MGQRLKKLTQKGDTYFGRGTTDDKGPALSALWSAVIEAVFPSTFSFSGN